MSRSDTPGATRAISATSGGTSHGLTVPTTPSVAWPVCRPCSIERSRCSASSSLRIARARSSTFTPNSVGHRAAPVPHEQLHAELGFELADVLGDVRLHRVEAVGGGGERAFFGDREQRLELADVHARSSWAELRPAHPDISE